MIDKLQLMQYQYGAAYRNRKRILAGGRQIGKTETIVHDVVNKTDHRKDYLLLTDTHRMQQLVKDRFDGDIPDRVRFETPHSIDEDPRNLFERFHAIGIEEAYYFDESLLFDAEQWANEGNDLLLVGTPVAKRSVIDSWVEHSPYWNTWRVGSKEAGFVDNERVDTFSEKMDIETEIREVNGYHPDDV